MFRYLISVILIAGVVSMMALGQYSSPVNPEDSSRKEFVIPSGQTLDQIATDLSQAGLIRSRTVFRLTVFRLNLSKKIQAGYFSLSPSQSTTEIATSLTKAQTRQVWITLPEGLRREEVANNILDKLTQSKLPHKFNPDEFIRLTSKLEGRLFPDTYAIGPNVTTQEFIEKMTDRFTQVVGEIGIKQDDLDRTVILASLVEREAGSDTERPEIAGIILNRVENKWPLQIDATVQYAIASSRCRIRICDWWASSLTKNDLSIDSPYNTYKVVGLPPGPIGNPGKSSLLAAHKPVRSKFWFYLHDPSGLVHYATTVEEHNKNVCNFLKKGC